MVTIRRLGWVALTCVLILTSCKQGSDTQGAVIFEISSTSAVDNLEIKIRNEAYTAYSFTESVSEKNILTDPYRIALQPTEDLQEKFLIYVKGYSGDSLIAANSAFADFRTPETITLRLRTGFQDADGDGFEDCGEQGRSFCDCNDNEPTWNPFTEDRCDNTFDENCTGFPNEGCPCSENIPCTILPANLANDMAGIGACTTGFLYCEDGVLSETCVGAGPAGGLDAIFEVENNLIDDDCDGTVDEGSSCAAGSSRACFLGLVDDLAGENPSAATARAMGICSTGLQTCDENNTWGKCEGETRSDPTRAPLYWAETHLGDETPDSNLPISSRYAQCDGLDNDCDGAIDDEAAYDKDGDGYTLCGTCDKKIGDEFISCDLCDVRDSPVAGTSLCSSMIDCDDGNAEVHPRNEERCDNSIDDDCRCDHSVGANVTGQPILLLTGAVQCVSDEAFLDCSRPERSDGSSTGLCSGGDLPGVYYYGFSSDDSDNCYYCGTSYGLQCQSDGVGCTEKQDDCETCAEPDYSSLPLMRQTCRQPGGGCSDLEPPQWELITVGDPYDDCGFVSCAGYYWGIENNRCYGKLDQEAARVDCKPGGECETAFDRCSAEAQRSELPLEQALCTQTIGGCDGVQDPVVENQPNNADVFDQCSDPFICDNSGDGGGPFYYGVIDDDGNSLANGECYFRADILSADGANACNGSGDCQTRLEACSTSAIGEAVGTRPACEYPLENDTCYGEEGPDYLAVSLHTDPYGDCSVDQTCCVSGAGDGMCCRLQGQSCGAQSECALGLTCVDGICCSSACDTACYSCRGENNTVGVDGTCSPLNTIAQDTSPGNLCSPSAGNCGGDGACICEAGSGNCKRDAGNTCSTDDNCSSGFCECANGDCTLKRCSPIDCDSCLFNVDGDSVCEGLVADDIIDAGNSCGSTSCNGLGGCNVVNGNACATNNNQECLSNVCVLGTCSNLSPTGGSCDETADCEQGVCNADNVCRIPGSLIIDNGLLTSERVADQDDSFQVSLTSKPIADVVVNIASSNEDEAIVIQSVITFSTSNWNTPQTVTVRGQNDNMADGSQPFSITLSFSSSDDDYAALANEILPGTNVDDDVAGVSVSPITGLAVSESGTSASFSVVLNTEPSHNVNIPIVSGNTNKAVVDDNSLRFKPSNWSTPQTVNITGIDNDIDDDDELVTIALGSANSADSEYSNMNVDSVEVTVTNDDIAGIEIMPTVGLETSEAGGTADFTVVLTSEPLQNVSVGFESSDATEGSLSSTNLVFTASNWDSPKTVTVIGQDDDIDDGNKGFSIITAEASSSDSLYQINPDDIFVTNVDDDTAGVTLSQVSGLSTTEGGGQDSFTIVLDSEPTSSVTINLSTNNADEVSIGASSVVFSNANWDIPKTITLTGQNDDVDDDNQSYNIILSAMISADGNYSGTDVPDVSGTNEDDDTAEVIVTPLGSMVTSESSLGTASFTVVLGSQPASSVEVQIESQDTTEGTVDLSSVVFNAINWDDPITVQVSPVDDDIDDGNVTYAISLGTPITTDPKYGALGASDVDDVDVLNQDDDTAGFLISEAGSLDTDEGGLTDSFSLKLASEPTNSVTVNITSTDTGEVLVVTEQLVFGASNWDENQTITVAGVDDNIVDGTKTVTVSLGTGSSLDGNYNNLTVGSALVDNADDEPQPSVSIADGSVTEGDAGMATLDMVLSLDYASESAVTVHWATADGSAQDSSDYTAASGTVTFSPLDQEETISVSVSGDFVDEGDQTFTVTLDSPTQAQLGDASGVATIVNDDIAPVVTLLTAASGVVAPVTQDTIAIECAFTDGNDPSKTTFDITVAIRDAGGASFLVCDAVSNGQTCEGGNQATITRSSPGVFSMTVDWNPTVGLASGIYDLSCAVFDWGLNVGIADFDDHLDFVELDAVAPPPPVVTSSLADTTDTTPTWTWVSGGADGSGVYRTSFSEGDLLSAAEVTDLSYTPTVDLSLGAYTLYVQERDTAGNWSDAGTFTVTVSPP
ncbi:MAG: hypothetical protein HOK28_19930 [Deltaproteobacteria bacterium]|nr:hypothetical protein [Deltaproteobacteria bacterium]